MTGDAWPARLSATAAACLKELNPLDQERVRDLLDIASRDPYRWPQFQLSDPDGEDLRAADYGPISVIYWINRAMGHLLVVDIVRLPDMPGAQP